MHNDDILELYDDVKEDMKFLITSDVRSKILLSLREGPKDLADLKKDMAFSSSTILHGMYLLEDKEIVFRESGKYYLSQIGELVVLKLINLIQSCSALKKIKLLFLEHEMGVIPSYLQKDIECLESCQIVESSSQDLMKPYNVLQENVLGAKKVNFISAVFYPFYLDLLQKAQDNKMVLNFILTRDIIDSIKEAKEDVLSNLNPASKVNLWEISGDLKLSFTMADEFMALGLFSVDGVYDSNKFLIGEGPEVLNWGKDLFNHYLKQSTRIKL